MKPGLLLHHCCAPCSVGPLSLLKENFALTGFWFNPNIHPGDEYELRKKSLIRFVKKEGIELTFGPDYAEDEWFKNAAGCAPGRCTFCYYVRFKETARRAKLLGLEAFTTTLLSSPYQKHELIIDIAAKAAGEEGVKFYYEDFRPYFYEGKTKAKALGFYMQKYCGCKFSKEEREQQKKTPRFR